jgi:hypothetical protein
MKNWLYAMNQVQISCNASLSLLNGVGETKTDEINGSLQSVSALLASSSLQLPSTLMNEPSPTSPPGTTARSLREQLIQQRMKIENCRHLAETLEPIFLRVLGRICEDDYSSVDAEFAAAQKPVVQAALQFIVLLQNSCLSDAACGMKNLFDDQWTRNLDLALQILSLTPKSLQHVHVRDMRYVGYMLNVYVRFVKLGFVQVKFSWRGQRIR